MAVGDAIMAGMGLAAQHAAGQMQIKAAPKRMQLKAEEIRVRAVRIQADLSDMTRAIDRTQSYWNGEAADLHREQYREMKPRAEQMLSMLQEHTKDLRDIAALYTGAETNVSRTTQTLPKDAIE